MFHELHETFFVNLSAPMNATISDGQGVATIVDDDTMPSLSISDVTVTEGNSGSASATFTVTLSAASGQQVTAGYATADGTATTAGNDYTATTGTLTFAPGVTTQAITVLVIGEDTTSEPNEVFFVNLGSPASATIADGQGGDDPRRRSARAADRRRERRRGWDRRFHGDALADNPTQTVTVNFATANGTATAGSDYQAASGMLTFPPGRHATGRRGDHHGFSDRGGGDVRRGPVRRR